MQHHVFLSYSRRDLAMMQRVRDDLASNGLSVWTDEGIHPGTVSWKESIERAIREAGMLVVLLSPDANDSRWVQREIDYAEVRGIPVLPLLIRGETRDAIPFALAGSQFVDVRSQYEAGFRLLVQRCYRYLPADQAKTQVSRRAETTALSLRSNRNHRIKGWLAVSSALGLLMLFVAGFLLVQRINAQLKPEIGVTNNPTITENPTSIPTAEAVGNALLRYNRHSLVLMNRDKNLISLYGLSFELDGENEPVVFSASEWISQSLNTGRCVQVWGLNSSYLPDDEPPADLCQSRVAYRSTSDIFWLGNNQPDAQFIISRYGQEVGRCPVITSSSEDTVHCLLNL